MKWDNLYRDGNIKLSKLKWEWEKNNNRAGGILIWVRFIGQQLDSSYGNVSHSVSSFPDTDWLIVN